MIENRPVIEENRSGSAMKTLLVVTAAFGEHNRHPCGSVDCSCHTPLAPLVHAVAGGAMVGTLAMNTMAPPAALKEVHPAAKMQTFRKVRLAPLPAR